MDTCIICIIQSIVFSHGWWFDKWEKINGRRQSISKNRNKNWILLSTNGDDDDDDDWKKISQLMLIWKNDNMRLKDVKIRKKIEKQGVGKGV